MSNTQVATQQNNMSLGELMHSPAVVGKLNEVWNSPQMANAVIHQRKLHACLMELTTNKSREVAARAIFLNYLDGDGRKLCTIPHYYERPTATGSVMVETYFSYIDRVH